MNCAVPTDTYFLVIIAKSKGKAQVRAKVAFSIETGSHKPVWNTPHKLVAWCWLEQQIPRSGQTCDGKQSAFAAPGGLHSLPNWPQRKEDTRLLFGATKAGGNGTNCCPHQGAKFPPESRSPPEGWFLLHAQGWTNSTHLAPKEGCEAPTVYPHGGGSMPPETPIHLFIGLKRSPSLQSRTWGPLSSA